MESLMGFLGHGSNSTSGSVSVNLNSDAPDPGARVMANETLRNMWKMLAMNVEANNENEKKERSPVDEIKKNNTKQEEQCHVLIAHNRELRGFKEKISYVYEDLVKSAEIDLHASVQYAQDVPTKYSQQLGALEEENLQREEQIASLEKENKALYEDCVRLESELLGLESKVKSNDQSFIRSIIDQQISRC